MNNLKCLLKLGSLIQKPRVAIMRSFNIEDKHSIDIDNFLMAKSCMDAIVSSSKILCSLTVSFSLRLCNVLHTKVQRPFAVFHWLLIHPAFTIIDMCYKACRGIIVIMLCLILLTFITILISNFRQNFTTVCTYLRMSHHQLLTAVLWSSTPSSAIYCGRLSGLD